MVFEALKSLGEKHERLKKRIHSFRIPLSPTGQRFMGFVYFTIPVIGGYYLMQWVIEKSEKNLSEKKTHAQLTASSEANIETKTNREILQQVLDRHKSKVQNKD